MELKKTFKIILALLIITTLAGCSSDTKQNTQTEYVQASNTNAMQDIEIPINEITTTAKFYSQVINGNEIKFFVVKDENEDIKVAFDACDICGGSKGYRQEGQDMVCNNCGRHFKISELGSQNIYGGGCWPSYLKHTIDGDKIIISTSDLEKGDKFF